MSYDLVEAKKSLAEYLGSDFKLYLQLLKSWFHKKLTKEDFDHRARKLLSTSSVNLHNKFLLALLSKCQNLSISSSTSSKSTFKTDCKNNIASLAVPNSGFFQCHLPVDVLSQIPRVKLQSIEQDDINPGYLATDAFLPNEDFIYGRIIVTAWEYGLESIEEKCSEILVEAIYVLLKNIMTSLVQNSSSYQLYQNKFIHSFGAPLQTESFQPQLFEAENLISEDPVIIPTKRLRHEINSDILKNQILQIDIFDMLDVFQKFKWVIASHTVRTLNHERTINRICHPTREEIQQIDNINSIKSLD